jgi:hypothetical protein
MGCASKEHRRLASQHDPFPLSSGGVVWLGRGLNEAGGWSEPQQCSRVWRRQGGRQVLPLQGSQTPSASKVPGRVTHRMRGSRCCQSRPQLRHQMTSKACVILSVYRRLHMYS